MLPCSDYTYSSANNGLVPEGRWGMPDDVGRAVASLLRGDMTFATGTIVNVDGGLSIPRL